MPPAAPPPLHHFPPSPPPPRGPLLAQGSVYDVICEWDRAFLTADLIKGGDEAQHGRLIDAITIANLLHAGGLLELCCSAVASMIKDKSPRQIRALFNIENDFTPEEEERIREENRWCEEA